MNPLVNLRKQSQSIWLDYIRRDLIRGGELEMLIQNDGLFLENTRLLVTPEKRSGLRLRCGLALRPLTPRSPLT